VIASLLTSALGVVDQLPAWTAPTIDWHAVAPELVLVAGINLVLFIDLYLSESKKWAMATLTGFVLLAAFVPVVTLAVTGDGARSLFDGRYVVDNYALILKAIFLLVAYVIVLMSQTELEEGGYYQGEFYVLMLCSVLGMVMMASARDLISIFVALELLSIPAYMMAAWRKRDPRSNEAGVKYYILGVFASAVLLYGMSFLFGTTGTTKLTEIGESLASGDLIAMQIVAIVFVIGGLAFKVSAVPFHSWAPDTYEGAPTPVTAFLSVASKTAGFVALMSILFLAFGSATEISGPLIWVLAALTMTVGNVVALRQTNIVRMLAYSSVSQGGFILMPLAVMGSGTAGESAIRAVIVYLLVYAFMNLGAFAVVIAVARRTRSGEISSFGGLFGYAPAMGVLITIFLASLAGIPPLGGWVAKFNVFKTVIDAGTTSAYVLALIGAVNTVIAAAYYMRVLRVVWMAPAPDGNTAPLVTPPPVAAALGITAIGTLVVGVLPGLVLRFGALGDLTGAALGP
jgi:NADH-quinone oxidoreductase subunit N